MLIIILHIVTLVQILFFSVFLILKRKDRLSNKILIAFLISQAFIYINNLFFLHFDLVYEKMPHLFFTGSPAMCLWAPLIYFYTCSLTNSLFRFKPVHIVHLLPFLCLFIFIFLAYHIKSVEEKRLVFEIYDIGRIDRVIKGIVHIQIFAYILTSIIKLSVFRQKLKDQYSEIEKINLSWLSILLYSYMVAWMVTLMRYIISDMNPEIALIVNVMVYVFFFIFFNIIVFKGLSQPEIFTGLKEFGKPRQQSLSQAKQNEYKEQLESFMQENKPYLKPGITLKELSDLVSIPPRSLSEVLNTNYKLSFFDFINNYRILEVEHILQNSSDKKITVSEVFFQSGFNSKSAFYSAYKKIRGHSPSKLKASIN